MQRRARSLAAAVMALPLSLAPAACSRPTDTQPFPGACESFQAIAWEPAPDTGDALRDGSIRVTLNDYPDPDTVGSSSFLLTTGVYWYTGAYAVDLRQKTIAFRPAGALRENLGYTVSVLPALQSLSGCTAKYQQQSFRTGVDVGSAPPADITPFAAVEPILAQHCAGSGCHRETTEVGAGCLAVPAAGLSLCGGDARDALVDVPSRQVARLRLVQPGSAARSYLMRKLLPADPGGGPIPTTLGQREPPGPPLTDEELGTMAAWIDSGASP